MWVILSEFCLRMSLVDKTPKIVIIQNGHVSQCDPGPLFWIDDQIFYHVSIVIAIFLLRQPNISQC